MNRLAPVCVQRFQEPRTLVTVLHEIAEAERRWKLHCDSELESELLDAWCDLQAEGRRMVSEQLGVTWSALERGLV